MCLCLYIYIYTYIYLYYIVGVNIVSNYNCRYYRSVAYFFANATNCQIGLRKWGGHMEIYVWAVFLYYVLAIVRAGS